METFYNIKIEKDLLCLIKSISNSFSQSPINNNGNNIDPIILLIGYIDYLYNQIVNSDDEPSPTLLQKMKNNLSTFNGALPNSIYRDVFADFSKNIEETLKQRGINL